jgi:hypothetical protein
VFLVVVFALARTNSRVSNVVSGPVHFEQIPEEHWYPPSWIDEARAKEERDKMEAEGVIYGGSQSYVFPLRICVVVTRVLRTGIAICAGSTLGSVSALHSFASGPDEST